LRKKKFQTPSVDQMQPYLREAPVRIFDLIQDHGITLTFTEMEEGISGSVEAKNEKFEIVVNSALGDLHRRYAAAYELSRLLFNRHSVIDHEGPVVSRLFAAPDKKGRTGTDPDAARLAAGLLMPAEGVRGMNASGQEPQKIAAAYEVTGAAARGRLRQLYLTPNEPSPSPEEQVMSLFEPDVLPITPMRIWWVSETESGAEFLVRAPDPERAADLLLRGVLEGSVQLEPEQVIRCPDGLLLYAVPQQQGPAQICDQSELEIFRVRPESCPGWAEAIRRGFDPLTGVWTRPPEPGFEP